MKIRGNIPGGGLVDAEIEAERIAAVSALGPADPSQPFVSPGLIDIQINGFAGVDFSAPELEPEHAVSVLPALLATGVTTFCPTLITNTHERILRSIQALEKARRLDRRFARAVPGYHLEGPYLSPGPSHGAHDPALMRPPDWEEFEEFQRAAEGRIRIVTLAPELPGALDFIRRARQAGVLIAIGHTDGTAEDIHRAAEAGATLSVHLGNGCPELIHRHRAPIWAQLADDRLAASIICDTFHLPPELVEVVVRAKGIERLVLITDAIQAAGMPAGKYTLAGVPVELMPNGQVVRGDRKSLAGSSVSMNRAVSVFVEYARVSLADAIAAATRSPARLLGDEMICTQVAAGQPANLIVFRPEADRLKIESTMLAGEFVVASRPGADRS